MQTNEVRKGLCFVTGHQFDISTLSNILNIFEVAVGDHVILMIAKLTVSNIFLYCCVMLV